MNGIIRQPVEGGIGNKSFCFFVEKANATAKGSNPYISLAVLMNGKNYVAFQTRISGIIPGERTGRGIKCAEPRRSSYPHISFFVFAKASYIITGYRC